jgi:hypothetical protein
MPVPAVVNDDDFGHDFPHVVVEIERLIRDGISDGD